MKGCVTVRCEARAEEHEIQLSDEEPIVARKYQSNIKVYFGF